MALIYRDRVIDMVDVEPEQAPYATDLEPAFWTDVTDLVPQPQSGWRWNGTGFEPG